MSNWMIWLIAAGVVVILEIFTGTFYLLMISAGLAAAACAAWLGAGMPLQLVVAGVVGAIATYALRRSKLGTRQKIDAARDPNVLLDIGRTIVVRDWQIGADGKCVARVSYRGAMWDVELERGEEANPGTFTIHEVRGSRLIVTGALS